MIQKIEKDNEITQLTLKGGLDDQQVEKVFRQLTNLFSMDDRTWTKIQREISFAGNDAPEYLRWKETMEEYTALYSQMKMQYSVPVEMVRPHQQQ